MRVSVHLESTEVFAGEPFTLQIRVSGEEEPEPPEMTAVAKDFAVAFAGPRSNNSTQISIVNGKVTRAVTRETILVYQLTAKAAGLFTIPSLTVRAGARSAFTEPVQVRVREPLKVDPGTLSLSMELSKSEVTVGEALTVSWTWTVGTDVRGFQFGLPLLQEKDFHFPVVTPEIDPALRDRYLQIERPDGKPILGMQRRTRLGGRDVVQVTFHQVMIPLRAGTFALPKSTVVCEVLAGYRQRDDRDFGFPFGMLDRDRGKVYRRAVAESDEAVLMVRDLPEEGRPADFAGHVGRYDLRAEAQPTDVNVGDPITLTLYVSGPEYLDRVEGPPLEANAELVRDFRISDPEPGTVDGRLKVFKRILRAKHPDVNRIPPIRLPYFDSNAQSYRVAETAPIPLTVRAVRVVTAQDAEGVSAPVAPGGRTLQAWSRGIAANYEDLDVLENRDFGWTARARTPAWNSLLAAPPVGYALLLTLTLAWRKRRSDPAARAARTACRRARRGLDRLARSGEDPHAGVLDILRQYLGAKLGMSPGALVFRDVAGPLRAMGLPEGVLADLERLFETCEAGRYAGTGAVEGDRPQPVVSARTLLAAIEGGLS
ncbi:MAG: BatD family protein [Lentisphaeria bacterium]|nr:BatD family protein [Lentisphaeria bacterium]